MLSLAGMCSPVSCPAVMAVGRGAVAIGTATLSMLRSIGDEDPIEDPEAAQGGGGGGPGQAAPEREPVALGSIPREGSSGKQTVGEGPAVVQAP